MYAKLTQASYSRGHMIALVSFLMVHNVCCNVRCSKEYICVYVDRIEKPTLVAACECLALDASAIQLVNEVRA